MRPLPCPPSRCPYCPDRPQPNWIHWGSYERYVERRRDRIDVDRHRCRFTRRTFSLLPDGLLPYHHLRSSTILRRLWQIVVDEAQTSPLARLLHARARGLRGGSWNNNNDDNTRSANRNIMFPSFGSPSPLVLKPF